jgi:hypothetical protein
MCIQQREYVNGITEHIHAIINIGLQYTGTSCVPFDRAGVVIRCSFGSDPRVETKIFVFVFSRKFIFAFREKSLRKVTKITKIFAKTKMYEKMAAGNGKYCEIS